MRQTTIPQNIGTTVTVTRYGLAATPPYHHLRANAAALALLASAIGMGIAVACQQYLLIAVIALLALAIFFPVEMSLGMFLFSIPFDTILLLGNSHTSLSWTAGAFAGAVVLLYGLLSRRLHSPPQAAYWWGLFALWTAASVVWAIDPGPSVIRLPTVICILLLYVVIASFEIKKKELSRMFVLAIAGGLVTAGFLIYQAHGLGLQNRATLAFGNREANPNDVAVNLLLPFALAIGGVLAAGSRAKKALLVGALAILATAIFLTMSRGAVSALTAAMLIFAVKAGASKRMLVPVLAVALPLLVVPSLFFSRMKEAPTGRGTGRLDILIAGTEIVKHNPVIGVGLANFPVAYERYSGYAPVFRGYQLDPHNIYLQVWAETGVVGLSLFFLAVYKQMKDGSIPRSRTYGRNYMAIAVQSACWGMLVAGVSGNIQWSKGFWLNFMLLALASRQAQQDALLETTRREGRGSFAPWNQGIGTSSTVH